MQRIHITGVGPRTGTTLLMEMMVACFEIDSFPEHEASVYREPARSARVVLTKAPHEVGLAQRALEELPDLHVLYLVRDPRDMIVSKHAADPDRYWVGLNFWKCLVPCGRRLSGHPRFVMIRFEELLRDPDSVQTALIARMPFLKKLALFSRYSMTARPSQQALEALGGLRPPSSASIGNWRSHLQRVAGQIQRHGPITADLIEFGFECDSSWESHLKNVVPDSRASRWPDEWTLEEICPPLVPRWLLR